MNEASSRQGRPSGRKVAEWVTLCVSIALVAGVAGYLVYDSTRPQEPSVPVEVLVLPEQARAEGTCTWCRLRCAIAALGRSAI